MNSIHLLLVDDEYSVLLMFQTVLKEAGYTVQTAHDAFEAANLLEQQQFNLLLIDLKLPGPSGLSLVERAVELQEGCAIIMFSANATREHIVDALRAGVDDFLIKPFSNEDLRQAVGRALLKHKKRRKPTTISSVAPAVPDQIVLGPLTVATDRHLVYWHGSLLSLTPTEYCMLLLLAQNVGQSVSAEALIRRCRGYSTDETEARLLLKPHIANLRQKLEQSGRYPRVLLNHRSRGFFLNLEQEKIYRDS